jgi:hypothetical protein
VTKINACVCVIVFYSFLILTKHETSRYVLLKIPKIKFPQNFIVVGFLRWIRRAGRDDCLNSRVNLLAKVRVMLIPMH